MMTRMEAADYKGAWPAKHDPLPQHEVLVARQRWTRDGKRPLVGLQIKLRFRRMGGRRVGKKARKAAKRERQRARVAVT